MNRPWREERKKKSKTDGRGSRVCSKGGWVGGGGGGSGGGSVFSGSTITV